MDIEPHQGVWPLKMCQILIDQAGDFPVRGREVPTQVAILEQFCAFTEERFLNQLVPGEKDWIEPLSPGFCWCKALRTVHSLLQSTKARTRAPLKGVARMHIRSAHENGQFASSLRWPKDRGA